MVPLGDGDTPSCWQAVMVGDLVIKILHACVQQPRELFSSFVTSCGDGSSRNTFREDSFCGREKLVILTPEAQISA